MILRQLGRLGFSQRIQLGKDIKSIKDSYNAVHITPLISISNSSFQEYMSGLLKQSNSNATSSIWVHLAKGNLSLIDELVCRQGFKMHHSKGQEVSLYKWVKQGKKDLVPAFSTHIIGCGGVIIRDDKVLLVEEKSGPLKGKFGIPGGRADPSEGIKKCSQREVYEEVGLRTTFKKILWLRELSGYVYGSFDMYYACLMSLKEEQIRKLKPCEDEIASIVWVHLRDMEQFMVNNSVGTQQQMAKYLGALYQKGYDFSAKGNNYKDEIYESPLDHKKRWFGQHFLG